MLRGNDALPVAATLPAFDAVPSRPDRKEAARRPETALNWHACCEDGATLEQSCRGSVSTLGPYCCRLRLCSIATPAARTHAFHRCQVTHDRLDDPHPDESFTKQIAIARLHRSLHNLQTVSASHAFSLHLEDAGTEGWQKAIDGQAPRRATCGSAAGEHRQRAAVRSSPCRCIWVHVSRYFLCCFASHLAGATRS